jgi:DNA primase
MFYRRLLSGSWVPGYLTGRGFAPAVQEHWQAGYAPAAWDTLTRHLRADGAPDTLIEAAGLARRSRRGDLIDTFRDRAMLPIRSGDGAIVAFIGRAAEHADPRVPKYLNSPGTDLYNKSEMLFGLWEARGQLARGARPVIVEGPFDAIAVTTACAGRNVGVSPCGAVLTGQQATALEAAADLRTAGVLVAFDPDQAGRRAAISAYHLLSPLTGNTTAAILPPGRDPAQILWL